ncbi:hypothetical protein [Actinomadura geliboluensis]|uniref:hypothetical protein n=1 Tax=Actinomadura geliboluensis TaxID=882440 RepID=UPI0036C2C84B
MTAVYARRSDSRPDTFGPGAGFRWRIAVLGREIEVGRLPRVGHMVAAAGAGFALPEEIPASCDISTARP